MFQKHQFLIAISISEFRLATKSGGSQAPRDPGRLPRADLPTADIPTATAPRVLFGEEGGGEGGGRAAAAGCWSTLLV